MWTIASRAIGVWLPKPIGAHISPSGDDGHEAIGFIISSARFQCCFGSVSHSSLGMGLFTLCHCMLKICNFLFNFYMDSQPTICLESKKRFWTLTFGQCWNC
jgi:hypothetical protein